MVKKERKSFKIISLLMVVTLFVLLPFVYNSNLQDPELTLRFIVFSGLLSVVFLVLLFNKTLKQSLTGNAFLRDKPIVLFFVFLLIAGVSSLRGFDSAAAMYDLLRITLMYLSLLAFTVLFKNNYAKKEHFIIGIAVAVMLFTLFEVWFLLPDLLSKGKSFQVKFWYGSTLANKNLYCEALFMFLPFLASGILSFKSRKKYLCATSLVISLITIFFLQSLSVILAVVITGASLITTLYYFKINILPFSLSRKAKTALLSSVIIAFIGCAVLFVHTGSYEVIKHKFASLSQLLSENSAQHSNKAYGSFSERILLWQHTIRMIKDYPLFGCGLSNWKTLLPHYGVFGISFMDAGTLKLEHPHNDYLLMAAETGLVGLMVYLLVFFFVLRQAFINFKKSVSNRNEAIGNLLIFYGIAGFMILSMFEFPKERFYPFLMLMILFAWVSKAAANKPVSKKSFAFDHRLIFIPYLIISIYSCWFFTKRHNGEVLFSDAIKYQQRKDWMEMKNSAAHAESDVFKSDRLAIPVAWYAGFASFYGGDVASAEGFFERAVKLNPYFIQGWNDLGTCYEQTKNYPQAITCYKTALSINPDFFNTRLNLVAVYYNMGKTDSAYQVISSFHDGGGSPQYKNYLLTILRNKLNKDFSAITEEPARSRLEKMLKNDRYLINEFFEAKKININIDSLIYNEIKK